MGKTPEKVISSAAPMMRYRRKVPSAVAAAEVPVAVETKQQGDNQMEHREAEPVVGGGNHDHVKRDERPQPLKQKPLNTGGAARKKKPKANASAKEAAGKSNEAFVEASASQNQPTVEVIAVPKKKLKKRQLSNNHNDNTEAEAVEPVDRDVELVKPKPTWNRKRKSDVNSDKHKGPSLLKQLLWKAKPSSSQSSLPVDAAPQDVGIPPPALSPAALGKQQHHQQTKLKRSPRPSVEDRDEQEEMAYTVSERHSRKLQASKTAVQPQRTPTDWCNSAAVVSTALSSQETQSGSDDDEASTVFMSAFENLVPSSAIQPTDLSNAVEMNVFYPVPFPLALMTDVDARKQQGLRVHEVLIENFAFHPPQLHIRPGDVVVWRVSGETLGMVEHSLEASLMMRGSQQKKPTSVKATTPPLGSGSSFAWRFETPARIQIECSVYKTKGVVLVKHPKNKKKKKTLTTDKAALPAPSCDVPVDAPAAPQPAKKWQKRKEKGDDRKRAAAEARAAAALAEGDQECCRDSMGSDVAVFHRPHDLARSAELDAGVCREVLSQLEEVVAAVHAATDVIVIGDVECPVVPDISNQDESENPAVRLSTHVDSLDKPFALADEWSGTEEEDDDEDRSALYHTEESTIEDFQQRVIGMLKRSEEARAQHRRSFQQEESGFDAGAAYDFFKQRFKRVQEEQQIVYAVCPEQQCGSGMGATDVVSLLLSDSSI